jgi:hypothetical protein
VKRLIEQTLALRKLLPSSMNGRREQMSITEKHSLLKFACDLTGQNYFICTEELSQADNRAGIALQIRVKLLQWSVSQLIKYVDIDIYVQMAKRFVKLPHDILVNHLVKCIKLTTWFIL